ncbi:MAG: hypothetical protein AAB421_04920 [Patescibacteria group bacterium]
MLVTKQDASCDMSAFATKCRVPTDIFLMPGKSTTALLLPATKALVALSLMGAVLAGGYSTGSITQVMNTNPDALVAAATVTVNTVDTSIFEIACPYLLVLDCSWPITIPIVAPQ